MRECSRVRVGRVGLGERCQLVPTLARTLWRAVKPYISIPNGSIASSDRCCERAVGSPGYSTSLDRAFGIGVWNYFGIISCKLLKINKNFTIKFNVEHRHLRRRSTRPSRRSAAVVTAPARTTATRGGHG